MRCQGCGKKLRKNESFCTSCGFYNKPEKLSLENDDLGNLDYFDDPYKKEEPEEMKTELLDEYDDNDDLEYEPEIVETSEEYGFNEELNDKEYFLKLFIGEDYELIAHKPINTYALLFSWMYFLYRKLYLIGIFGLIITGLVLKLAIGFLPYYIVIVMILSGLFFNPIYLSAVKSKVERLKEKYSEYEVEDLENACINKGGVSPSVALLIFCIFLAIMALTYVHIDFGEEKPKFWKENNESYANCILMSKNAFKAVEKELFVGTLDSSICNVRITGTKSYDIYLKIKKDNKFDYYYLKNNGKYLVLEGDTSKIETWKNDKDLLEEEKKMLEVSIDLENQFDLMQKKANEEENLVKTRRNNTQRVYFYLTKDEIFKK